MIEKYLNILGLEVEDKITKFRGVATSISFDLFGCIQVLINPGMNSDNNKLKESYWFDISRLAHLSNTPVMQTPSFDRDDLGPEHKPLPMKA